MLRYDEFPAQSKIIAVKFFARQLITQATYD